MTVVAPVTVINTIKPRNGQTFPVVEDVDTLGGYSVVVDIDARDELDARVLKVGKLVYVLSTSIRYRLTSESPVTWVADVAAADVVGPGLSTDNAIVRWNGTTGALQQNSIVTIADDGAIVVAGAEATLQSVFTVHDGSVLADTSFINLDDDVTGQYAYAEPGYIAASYFDTLSYAQLVAITQTSSAYLTAFGATAAGSSVPGNNAASSRLVLDSVTLNAIESLNATSLTISHLAKRLVTATVAAWTVNPLGADFDFVVQGDTNPFLVHSDAGLDAVGIGGAAVSGRALTVTGEQTIAAAIGGFAAPLLITKGGQDVFQVGYTGSTLSYMRVTAGGSIDGIAALLLNGQYGALLSPELYFSDGTGAIGGDVTLDVNTHEVRISTNISGGSYLDSARFGRTLAVLNEAGADIDLRAEGDTDPFLITADAGLDLVAIGGAADDNSWKLRVYGSILAHHASLSGTIRAMAPSTSTAGSVETRTHLGDPATRLVSYGSAFSGTMLGQNRASANVLEATAGPLYISTALGQALKIGTFDVEHIGVSSAGDIVFNETGVSSAATLRVEGDTNPNLLTVGTASGVEQVVIGSTTNPGTAGSVAPLVVTRPTANNICGIVVWPVQANTSATVSCINQGNTTSGAFGYSTSAGSLLGISLSGKVFMQHAGTGGMIIGSSSNVPMYLGTNNIERLAFTTSTVATVLNDTGADIDERHEGDTDANLLTIDAGLDIVFVGIAPGGGPKLQVGGGARFSSTASKTVSVEGGATSTSNILSARNSSSASIYEIGSHGSAIGTTLFGISKNSASTFEATAGLLMLGTSANNPVYVGANAIERLSFLTAAVVTVLNDPGGDIDWRFEGDTEPSLFCGDASVDRIGIGTSAPINARVHIKSSNAADLESESTSTTGYGSLVSRNNGNAFIQMFSAGSAATGNWLTNDVGGGISRANTMGLRQAESGSAVTTGLFFAAESNVPFYLGQNNTQRLAFLTTSAVINENGSDYDLRAEGDTDTVLFTFDAGLDMVGIGVALAAHTAKLTVNNKAAAVPVQVWQDNGTEFARMDDGALFVLAANAQTQAKATSPAQITADQNNYVLTGGRWMRLSTDASRSITGIAGGTDGREIVLTNVGAFDLVLTNEDAASTAANRILTGKLLGASTTLSPGTSATLIYDSTTARWRVVATQIA